MTGIACEKHGGVFVVFDSSKYTDCPLCKFTELFLNESDITKGCLRLARLINQSAKLFLVQATKEQQDQNDLDLNTMFGEIESRINKRHELLRSIVLKS